VEEYGKSIRIIGPKKILYAVASPIERKEEICNLMEILFTIPTVPLPNFLSITLTPSN